MSENLADMPVEKPLRALSVDGPPLPCDSALGRRPHPARGSLLLRLGARAPPAPATALRSMQGALRAVVDSPAKPVGGPRATP